MERKSRRWDRFGTCGHLDSSRLLAYSAKRQMEMLAIAAFALANYACPIVLVWVWVSRLAQRERPANARAVCSWVSLALVSLAVLICWLSAFSSPPPATPQWDIHVRKWSRVSLGIAVLAFIFGVFGKGKKQGWVVAATITVPLFWFLAITLE